MSEASDSESVADSDFASGSIAGSHTDTDPEGPMFPLVATYVVFSIDPVATLAALDDPEVTAAASSLNPKKYVGYVRNTAGAHNVEAEFTAYQIDLLRQGPTPKSSEDFVESDMCVAVLPNTTGYPLDRPPLQPTTPLPWPDCYHSSFDNTIVRVATRRAPLAEAVQLPSEEMRRQIYYQVIDQTRVHNLRKAHRITHTDLVGPNAPSHQANLLEEQHTSSKDQAKPVEDVPAEVEADSDAMHEDIRNIVAIMDETPPSTMPVALMTYDLSTVETVSDPQEFFDECMVLEQLERDHYARNVANTAAAIEHARKVDDEAFANMPRPQPTSDPVPTPVEASAGQTQIRRPSVWTGPKRTIVSINQYFKEHPFWGEPVDPPPAIVIVFRRLGARIGKIGRSCACGTLGPVERSSKSGLKSEMKVTVLNEKVPVTDAPLGDSSPSANTKHRRVSSEVFTPQTEPELESTQPQEESTSQFVQRPQQEITYQATSEPQLRVQEEDSKKALTKSAPRQTNEDHQI
ncbi:hypothetical protein PILCRDRAFT_811913 [Piloderma croceum F 1598]|uniref:Uncharacterized protein n=1 Tax=Piloderma croceum (strain F 1598) TaxID=765440 RepID=A0A0C3GES1_PILCF|nr:hypothetical protein PILCRDRAFT_811913 [Piloderma croceum F 1598]